MIVLGRVTAPYGVKGWVRIHPFGDDPLAWRRMQTWWLAPTDGADADWKPYTLSALREHGSGFVALFDECKDRSAAEGVEGFYFGAPREALPEPDEDEFYWADLIGLQVVNQSEEVLGVVESLISTGAHDVLQIRDGEQERLIPFVAAYVKEVEPEKGRIRVDWEKDW